MRLLPFVILLMSIPISYGMLKLLFWIDDRRTAREAQLWEEWVQQFWREEDAVTERIMAMDLDEGRSESDFPTDER